MSKMNIAVAINRSFEKYLYVMLTSLLESNNDQHICIYLMETDLTEEQISNLEKLVKSYGQEFCLLAIGQDVFPKELPTSDSITIESYFRLALPDLLPEDADRVLYLDADIIVDQSIADLYYMDFEEKSLCACKDIPAVSLNHVQESELFAQLRQKPDFVYFNAGVLLMNLTKLRTNVSLSCFVEQALKVKDLLKFHDQDLLNYLFYGDVKLADAEKYDLYARVAHNSGIDYNMAKDHTAIIHYTGAKPWRHEEVRYSLERFWWEYAKKTPYYLEFLEEIVLDEIDTGYMDQLYKKLKQENDELRQIVDRCMQLLKKI